MHIHTHNVIMNIYKYIGYNSHQVWDGTDYKLNLLKSLQRKVILKKGWLAIARIYEIKQTARDMYTSVTRSKNAILMRVIFATIIQEGIDQKHENDKRMDKAAMYYNKRGLKICMWLLRVKKNISK